MNKKITLVLLSSLLLFGCGDKDVEKKVDSVDSTDKVIIAKEDKNDNDDNKSNNDELKSSVMSNFIDVMAEEPEPRVLYSFIENNIDEINSEDIQEIIKYYIAYLDGYKSTYDEKIYNEDVMTVLYEKMNYNITSENIDKLESGEIKNILKEIYSQGYILTIDGEYPYANVDYSKLLKFSDKYPEGLKLYLVNNSRYFEDLEKFNLGQSIDFEKYKSDILELENYLTKTLPSDNWNYLNYSLYKKRIALIFGGTEYNTIYDKETNKLKDEYNEFFNMIINNHLDSDYGKITKEIYDKIVAENYDPYYGAYNDINDYKLMGLKSNIYINTINDFDSNYQIVYNELTLENKGVEDKINSKVMETIDKGKNTFGWTNNDSRYLSVNSKIGYVRDNIISYEFFFTVSNEDYSDYETIIAGRTFDINTGDEVEIEELIKRSIITVGDKFNEKIEDRMNYLDSDVLGSYDIEITKNQRYYLNNKELVLLFNSNDKKESEIVTANYSFEDLLLDFGIDLR